MQVDAVTHAELVRRVARWLRNTQRNRVVLEEITTDGLEWPDVIGWSHKSTVVECKVSVADFKRDATKVFRQHPEMGLGDERWYACPTGLIAWTDTPDGWGLLWVGERTCTVQRKPVRFDVSARVRLRETRLLVSAVERATEGWGRKVFGELSPVDGQPDPHPSMAKTMREMRAELVSLRTELRARSRSCTCEPPAPAPRSPEPAAGPTPPAPVPAARGR
jgi:hypothetical protein